MIPVLGRGLRPQGAKDCSGFTYCDLCTLSSKQYGMPSGHSYFSWGVASYLITYIYDLYQKEEMGFTEFIIKSFILVLFSLSVSTSRYITGCHTPQQLIVGGLIGVGMGVAGFYIRKQIKNKKENIY